MYTLIIDGSFFAQRIRAAAGLTFLDNPSRDRAELMEGLANSIAKEVRTFDHQITRVIWAADYSSWRKSETPILPQESVQTEDEASYKANRDVDLPFDPKEFFSAVDEFTALISSLGVCYVKQYKAEADDVCYIASRVLSDKGFKSILWSSDGDFKTFINENVSLFKLPKRELFRIPVPAKSITEAVFGGNGRPDPAIKIISAVGSDKIFDINPAEFVLEQIIRGQAKDNIPPLFFWKKETKRGIQTRLVTWLMITKALKLINFDLTTLTNEHLYDEIFIDKLIPALFTITKQTRDVDHTKKVWASSRKLAFVDKREIPTEVWDNTRKAIIEQLKVQRLDHKTIISGQKIMSKSTQKPAAGFFSQFDMQDMQT